MDYSLMIQRWKGYHYSDYIERWERADLPADFSLQLQSKNVLFAFDSAEVERTTSFVLPRTETNDRIFAMAADPHNGGSQMRVKLPAQLQYSGGVFDGYVYAQSVKKDGYNCVLVFGVLRGLQAIQQAGNIGDILTTPSKIIVVAALPSETIQMEPIVDADQVGDTECACVKYHDDTEAQWGRFAHPMPSLCLMSLLKRALTALGVTYTLPTYADEPAMYRERLVPAIDADGVDFGTIRVQQNGTGMTITDNTTITAVNVTPGVETETMGVSQSAHYTAKFFKLTAPELTTPYVKYYQVTFPLDFPSDVMLIRYGAFAQDAWSLNPADTYYKDENGNMQGEPLAGRSVIISTGASYAFVRPSDLPNLRGNGHGYESRNQPYTTLSIDVTLQVRQAYEQQPGVLLDTQLFNNLPLMDVIRTIAYTHGLLVDYNATDGLCFFSAHTYLTAAPRVELDGRVIAVEELTRKIDGYAARNVVELSGKKDGSVAYTIASTLLDAEKTLYKCPWGLGDISAEYKTLDYAYIKDAEYNDDLQVYAPSDFDSALFRTPASGEYMECARMQTNSIITDICAKATTYKVTAKMSLLEYQAVTSRSVFLLGGIFYYWLDIKWQKGQAQITLAKADF